jgi:CheY-like chemotaxis protein
MAKARILLVEDDQDIRTLFRMTLTSAGYFVREARDGLEAIATLQIEAFDAILLDLSMPRIDGVSALDTFKVMENGQNIPIIAVSALDDPAVEERTLESGAVAFLHKPLTPQELLDALSQHLGH